MADLRTLTPDQHRAAALVGQGWEQKDVANELGVVPLTVSRWSRREDFQQAARNARRSHLAETPNAQATLEAALSATKSSGQPDWQIRVQAARALIGRRSTGGEPPEKLVRETKIFVSELDDANGDAS